MDERQKQQQLVSLLAAILKIVQELDQLDQSLVRRMLVLAGQADDAQVIRRRLTAMLKKLALVLESMGINPQVVFPFPTPTAADQRGREFLQVISRKGMARIDIVDRAEDGSAAMAIDGGEAIRLSPRLAILAELLAWDDGQCADPGGLVGWKTAEQLVKRLESLHGVKTTIPAIRQMVRELRRRLAQGGVNPWLLQSCRPDGKYRLAVRRDGSPFRAAAAGAAAPPPRRPHPQLPEGVHAAPVDLG